MYTLSLRVWASDDQTRLQNNHLVHSSNSFGFAIRSSDQPMPYTGTLNWCACSNTVTVVLIKIILCTCVHNNSCFKRWIDRGYLKLV